MCRSTPHLAVAVAIAVAVAAALSAGCAGPSGSAGPAGPARPRITFIRGARVFDGEKLLGPTNVVLRDGLIAAMGEAADQTVAPPGADVVDGRDRTLLPGLIDAHTHIWNAAQLRQAAALGVTTELDLMSDWKLMATLKAKAKEDPSMADLRSAGNPATSPKGHGTEYGLPIATLARPEQAEAFVVERLKEGSDYLKIVYEPGREQMTSLDRATLEACVAAAHRHGLLAVVHISKLEAAREALAAGADGLAHAPVDRIATGEFVSLAASRGAFVIPTLTVNAMVFGKSRGPAILADAALAPYLPPSARELLKAAMRWQPEGSLENAQRTVALLAARGVPILAGTDAPNPGTAHGASMHEELKLLVDSGLSPADALAAATSRPAARFHLADRGRIALGLRADVVLVQGDPTSDISATRRIEAVWRGGVRVDREAQQRAAAAEQVEAAEKPAGGNGGLVSDFEGGDFKASFGAGWVPTTDALFRGKSIASVALGAEGAAGTHGSLQITGEVRAGFAYPWSGVMFQPGPEPMAAADLSASRGFSFYARGDGAVYQAMVFSRSRGGRPSVHTFVAGSKWTQFHFTWRSDFDGLDGRDIMGIAFVAGPRTGTFRFQIDQVAMDAPGGGPVASGSR
ncbi:MAG TPA: amidohydrolase family protein [Myxococcaceae bacterium]|nr:amidohydrolase family protein [Myxococcaceae bacterium]